MSRNLTSLVMLNYWIICVIILMLKEYNLISADWYCWLNDWFMLYVVIKFPAKCVVNCELYNINIISCADDSMNNGWYWLRQVLNTTSIIIACLFRICPLNTFIFSVSMAIVCFAPDSGIYTSTKLIVAHSSCMVWKKVSHFHAAFAILY